MKSGLNLIKDMYFIAVYEFREDIKSRDDDIFALDFFLSLAVASLLFSIAMVIELYYSAVPE